MQLSIIWKNAEEVFAKGKVREDWNRRGGVGSKRVGTWLNLRDTYRILMRSGKLEFGIRQSYEVRLSPSIFPKEIS